MKNGSQVAGTHRRPRRLASLCALTSAMLLLAACGSSTDAGGKDSPTPPPPAPVDDTFTLSGSVGDGPVADAMVSVIDAGDAILATTRTGPSSRYRVEVPSDARFPLTVEARGGTDLVDGNPLAMVLLAVVKSASQQTAHASVLSTLAQRVAACSTGGVSTTTLNAGWAAITGAAGMGWDPDLLADPVTATLEPDNAAAILLANESLAEVLRRSQNALGAAGLRTDIDEMMTRLGCDLVDGMLDGEGDGSDTATTVVFHAASAAVLAEVANGILRIGGEDRMAALDAALATLFPGESPASVTSVDTGWYRRGARNSIVLLTRVDDDPSVAALLPAFESGTLSMANLEVIDTAAKRAASADPEQFHALLAGVANRGEMPAPQLSLAVDKGEVTVGEAAEVSWSAENVEACVATDGWSGLRTAEGVESTPALAGPTTFTLTCYGLVESVTRAVTVTTADDEVLEVDVEIRVAPEFVAAGGIADLTWSTTGTDQCSASGGWEGLLATEGSQVVGPLDTTTSFAIMCTNSDGVAAGEATVTVVPAPAIDFRSSVAEIGQGGHVELAWQVVNADSCIATGGWVGARTTAGTESLAPPTPGQTYGLVCTGIGGTSAADVFVAVTPPPAITDFYANPNPLPAGAQATLEWRSVHVTECVGTGAWDDVLGATGSKAVGPLSDDASYTLTCSGPSGSAAETLALALVPAPSVILTASALRLPQGESVTLQWESASATSCSASWTSDAIDTTGSAEMAPLQEDRTFEISCDGASGTDQANVAIDVVPPPAVTFAPSATLVAIGEEVSLTWSASDADLCTPTGAWAGADLAASGERVVSLGTTSTFVLECVGFGGSAVESLQIGVIPSPVVDLTVDADLVPAGNDIRLNWAATNSDTCTASGGWTGPREVSGSEVIEAVFEAVAFSLTCVGPSGNGNANVTVNLIPTPVIALNANATTIATGDSVTLTWTTMDADGCVGSDGWDELALSGSGEQTIGPLTADTTFVLTCTGAGGADTASVDVNVVGAPEVSLSASSASVGIGEPVTITWSATGATSCDATGAWNSVDVGTSGSQDETIDANAEFVMTCAGLGGTASASTQVMLIAPPTLTFSATATEIPLGGSVDLQWSATDTTSCMASSDWSGSRGATGSETFQNVTTDRQFDLACEGPSGTASATVTVIVTPAPIANLTTSAARIPADDSVTLTWTAANADSCSGSGAWTEPDLGTSGSRTEGPLNADATFTIECTGPSGSDAASLTIDVVLPPVVSLSVSDTSVGIGSDVTLAWSATDADLCEGMGGWTFADQPASGSRTETVNADTTFDLTCAGFGGTGNASVQVTAIPAPTLTLAASASEVAIGSDVDLTWATTNAGNCDASGSWSGPRGSAGTETITNVTADQQFELSCTGPSGSVNDSVVVAVTPAPVASMSANATTIAEGDSVTLTWSTTNADDCAGTGGWTDPNLGASGSRQVGPLSADATYDLTCTGPSGSDTVSVNIDVVPPPVVTLTASETTVGVGTDITLDWNTTDADSCDGSGDWSFGDLPASGSRMETISADAQFDIVCTGFGGQVGNASVQVTAVPVPTLSLTTTTPQVGIGGTVELAWSSTNATGCTADGAWSGSRGPLGSDSISNVTADSQFDMTCDGAGGSVFESVTVAVIPTPAITSFTASAAVVEPDGMVDLTWTTTDVDSCTGDWTGDALAASGSMASAALTEDTTFVLACTGPSGSDSASASVMVTAQPVIASFGLADPAPIAINGSVLASWSAVADNCTASGHPNWAGVQPTSGIDVQVAGFTSSATLNLECSNAVGTTTATVEVVVVPNPTASLGVSAGSVVPGGNVDLTWSSQSADLCSGSGGSGFDGDIGLDGTLTTSAINGDTTFAITCDNISGNASDMATVIMRVANVSWDAPTQNSDGSDIAGVDFYTLYFGNASGDYDQTQVIDGTTTVFAMDLIPGTWFFAMTVTDINGIESDYSNEATKVIPP